MTEAKTEHTLELIEAARLLKFNAATGWPQTFAHDKLAVLQTWRKGIERKDWFKEAATWQELLRLVVESDAIEHTTTTERVQTTPPIRRTVNPGYGSREWHERDFAGAQLESRGFLGGTLVTGYIQPAKYKDVTRHHITAPVFAAWLAARGKEPAPLVAAWFKAVGVRTQPETAPAQHAAAPVADSASNAPAWTVTKPQRYSGYAAPLHRFLAAAHREGKPRPTARDVLEAWRSERPAGIAKVLADGFDYFDANGDEKAADLEAIRKAIGRMTSAR